MALFLADIAFLFELALVAAGLATLHYAFKEPAALLRFAGFILVFGGIGTALCTGYYSVKYMGQGDFEHAYPQPGPGMAAMMGGGMMGMPNPSSMQQREPMPMGSASPHN